ncbi:uracil phosphoribosyltransferase [Zavarzinia sp.]|uniref:uracil phosphoribosyltransferase n=1 Tax=Zavarzinia sp. TaxID=2027920 RepID=UPI003BB4DDFC|nr:uracil phosphoribosyltransferase [Zavarzinia sp.]
MTEHASDPGVILVDHPLVQHKLTIMRKKETSTLGFRRLLGEIAMLLAYEVLRDVPTELVEIETPIKTCMMPQLAGKKLCLVSVLRAGDGLLSGMLDILPAARVGHVGLYRDPKTLQAVEYFLKLPRDIDERMAIVLDPMLATGNSAVAAINKVKQAGCSSIKFVSLLSAPEGIATLRKAHPDVTVYTAAIDECLNDHGYIVPGLGDAGDRLFGTK